MSNFKKYYLMRILLSALFGAGCGALLLCLRPYAADIFSILLIAMGLSAALLNLPPLVSSIAHIGRRGEWVNLLLSLASIGLGVALMLVQKQTLLVLLILYTFVLPLARVLLVSQRKRQLQRELPHVLIGLFVTVVFLTDAESMVFVVGAIVCFVLTAAYLVCALLRLRLYDSKQVDNGSAGREGNQSKILTFNNEKEPRS